MARHKTRKSRKIKRRKNLRHRGGMPGKTAKRVSFAEPIIIEFETPLEKHESSDYRLCPSFKHIRGHHFPCRYKNTIFENQNEFAEWYREEIKKTIERNLDKKRHLSKIRDEQLSATGNWNRYIPPEFRSYNEEGVIEDVLPFSPTLGEEESRELLRQKRRERKLATHKWLEDVNTYREKGAS